MIYCDCGYGLVGEIVRRLSGKSLDAFASERIFEPLGMKDTRYSVPEAMAPCIVSRIEINPSDAYLNS